VFRFSVGVRRRGAGWGRVQPVGLRALLPGIRAAEMTAAVVPSTAMVGPSLDLASPWAPRPNHLLPVVFNDIFGTPVLPVMTRADAMAVPAVARARHIIAGTVARIPLRAKRGDSVLSGADAPSWIEHTGSALSPFHRMLWTVDDLLFHGWSCWSRTNGAAGFPVRMDRLRMGGWSLDDAGRVKVDRGDGLHVLVDQSTVCLIPGPHEGLLGFAQATIRHARDLQAAVGQAAKTPAAHVVLKQTEGEPLPYETDDPNKTSITSLLDQWEAARAGKHGGVGYLPPGLDAREMGTFAAHLLESGRNAAAVDVARSVSLPADLLDAAGEASMTYANSRDNDTRAIQYGVGLYLSSISAALSQDATSPHGTRLEFDLEEWLKSPVPEPAAPATNRPTAPPPAPEEPPA
jgi:hypothetical protein